MIMARAFTNNGNIYARGKQGGPNVSSMRGRPTCPPLLGGIERFDLWGLETIMPRKIHDYCNWTL